MSLDEKINSYYELKVKADALKEQMDSIKQEIIAEMPEGTYLTSEGVAAKVSTSIKFKYKDEPKMIMWCEDNGYAKYVVKSLDTTNFNKALKESNGKNVLTESLSSYYNKEVSTSLSVSKSE